MAEIQAVKPVPQRGSFAASGLSPAAIEAANVGQVPTYNLGDILFGGVNEIGGSEINPDLINNARAGDLNAQSQIGEMLDEYNITSQQPQIAGTKVDPTGKRVADIPEDAPANVREELKEFGEGGTRLLALLESYGVRDPLAQQTIVDNFIRGEFFVDTSRGVAEGLRFMSEAPNLAAYMAMGAYSMVDAMGEKSFEEAWAERQDGLTKFSNGYERWIQDNIFINKTYGKHLNNYIAKKYKERYNTVDNDVYAKNYVLQPEIEGMDDIPAMEARIVSDELAEALMKFSYQELPFMLKTASFLAQNVTLSGPMGLLHVSRGNKKLEKLEDYLKNNPNSVAGRVDKVAGYRLMKQEDASLAFAKKYRAATSRIAERLGIRGSVGTAVELRKASDAIKSVDLEIDDLTKKLSKARQGGNSNEIRIAEAQLESANGRRNRLLFKGAKNPYFRELLVDESIVAFGQAAGYTFLPGILNDAISDDTGGVIGALGMAFTGRKIASGTVKYGIPYGVGVPAALSTFGTVTPSLVRGVGEEMVRTIEDITGLTPFVPDMRGMFIRRDFQGLEAQLGRSLTSSEAASIRAIAEITENLRPEQREQIYNGMVEFDSVRTRLINAVSEDNRARATELLNLSFAQISGLAPLQAIEMDAVGALKGTKLPDAISSQEQREMIFKQSNFLLEEFRTLVQKSGVDTEDSRFAMEFINNAKAAEEALIIQNADNRRDYLALVREYRRTSLEDPFVDLEPGFLDRMIELELRLDTTLPSGAVRSVEQQRKVVTQLVDEVREGLNKRYEALRELRGTGTSRRRLGKLVEESYDIHMESLKAKGKLAYTNLEKQLDGETIDFSNVVRTFMNDATEARDVPLRRFFDPTNEIWTSRSGRAAYSAFRDMAERNLLEELDAEDVSELAEYLSTKTFMDGTVNEDFIEGNVGIMEMAMFMLEREGSTFNPFKAGVFELDEVYRHFRNMGQRIAKTDENKARPYKAMASQIDNTMAANPKVGSSLQDVRAEYRDIVFDIKRKGSIGDKIDNSRTGPQFVNTAADGFNNPYKKGQTPTEWHKELVMDIGNAIHGKTFSEDDVMQGVQDLVRFWSNSRVTGANGGVEFAFDVTTKDGAETFKNLQNMLEANLFEWWGSARADVLKTQISRAGTPGAKVEDYDFDVLANLRDLKPYLDVNVTEMINGKKVTTKKSILDLDGIIQEETDISRLIAKNKKLQLEVDRFANRINDTLDDVNDDVIVRTNLRRNDEKKLAELGNVNSPLAFYKRYVSPETGPGAAQELQDLKALFVDNLMKTGVSRDDAIQRFNDGAKYMIFNGILKNAGEEPNSKQTFFGMAGDRKAVMTLSNPSRLIKDIENPNITAIMEEVGMSAEEIGMLEDMALFISRAGGVQQAPYTPAGVTRGISTNEIISRSFNLARGMVSPQYVAAELAFRLMSQNGIDSLKLAATDTTAGTIMAKMLQNPEEITDRDIRTLGTIATRFLAQELYYDGERIGVSQAKDLVVDFMSPNDIEAAEQDREKNS